VFIIDNFRVIFHGYQSSDPIYFEERSDVLWSICPAFYYNRRRVG